MRSRTNALALTLAVLALAPAARAEDEAGAGFSVKLENLDGPKARVQLEGEASHLPDGTLLHVALMVADRQPPVEAGFFRVTVRGGRYGGAHEWDRKIFAPLAYRTEVRLIMEVQNPSVKRFLARELGYPGQHVELLGAVRTLIGSDEERSAFQVQTLRTLREYQQRLVALHGELTAKLSVAATDPAFTSFEADFVPRLRAVRDDLKTWEKTRVVWYDAGIFSALGQALFQVDWTIHKHKEADESVITDLATTGQDLRRMLDGIDSRLPLEPGGPLREPEAPAPDGGSR